MSELGKMLGAGDESEPEEPEAPEDGDESEDDGADPTEKMAETMMEAIKSDDAEAFAKTLKAFFMHCDTEPHEEGPHDEPPMHALLGLSGAKEA
jgi:hypothetical protein